MKTCENCVFYKRTYDHKRMNDYCSETRYTHWCYAEPVPIKRVEKTRTNAAPQACSKWKEATE